VLLAIHGILKMAVVLSTVVFVSSPALVCSIDLLSAAFVPASSSQYYSLYCIVCCYKSM